MNTEPCRNCPFRRVGHIMASRALIIHGALCENEVIPCHTDGNPCRGDMIFKRGGSDIVFGNKEELLRSYPVEYDNDKTEIDGVHKIGSVGFDFIRSDGKDWQLRDLLPSGCRDKFGNGKAGRFSVTIEFEENENGTARA